MKSRTKNIIQTIGIGAVAIGVALLILLAAYMLIDDANAYSQCAHYEDDDKCWCIDPASDKAVVVSPSYCDEGFGREEILISAGWIASVAIIYALGTDDDPGLGIIPSASQRAWDIKSSPDGIKIEYAIPLD